jgi:hypothetical protein
MQAKTAKPHCVVLIVEDEPLVRVTGRIFSPRRASRFWRRAMATKRCGFLRRPKRCASCSRMLKCRAPSGARALYLPALAEHWNYPHLRPSHPRGDDSARRQVPSKALRRPGLGTPHRGNCESINECRAKQIAEAAPRSTEQGRDQGFMPRAIASSYRLKSGTSRRCEASAHRLR